jgi:cytosine/adenosine deaminase-related metal-dependent hydrolase
MPEQGDSWTLTARWIFPADSAPLESGTLTIAGETIQAAQPRGAPRADVDLGNVAVLPGFVNAHTHLDLSALRSCCPPERGENLPQWLRDVIRYRRGQAPEEIEAAVRAGLSESIAHGTTLLGDISAGGASWSALVDAPIRSVVFHEMLGPRTRAEETVATVAAWLSHHPATPTCRPGLSPHAPYSVHKSLFEAAAQLARFGDMPLATHLAESREELELLRERRGPFVDFLRELGVWREGGLLRDPLEVVSLCDSAPRLLLVHGNYLPLDASLPSQASIVYCPRTHAAFGHPAHGFETWLGNGVNVALGTDSLASNPDLDLLAEARFVRQQRPHIDGAALLRMATLNGAIALGWDSETGSLSRGKSADLVVVPLLDQEHDDPHDLIFASNQRIEAVMCRGRWIYGAPGS